MKRHKHSDCQERLNRKAIERCAEKKKKFTPLRQAVLSLLSGEHRVFGAYELLDRLSELGHASQPPKVYRALDFLMSMKLAHKIERLNGYVACYHDEEEHAARFMICRDCGYVKEFCVPTLDDEAQQIAKAHDFQVKKVVYEMEGVCRSCQT